MAAQIDYKTPNNYAESQNFNFTPTPSPLPVQKTAFDLYNKDFTGFLAEQETPTQIVDRYSNKYNIPFLQEQAQKQNENATYLGNKISAIPSNVATSSANSMLTTGQKARVEQSMAAPLTQEYNAAVGNAGATNTQLNAAGTNVNTAVGLEQAQQMKMTQPWLQKYDAMTIQNAAENTQWTAINSWELDRLTKNQAAGVQLSEGEQSRLLQLATQEAAFQSALDNIAAQGDQARQTKKAPTDLATLWSSFMG